MALLPNTWLHGLHVQCTDSAFPKHSGAAAPDAGKPTTAARLASAQSEYQAEHIMAGLSSGKQRVNVQLSPYGSVETLAECFMAIPGDSVNPVRSARA